MGSGSIGIYVVRIQHAHHNDFEISHFFKMEIDSILFHFFYAATFHVVKNKGDNCEKFFLPVIGTQDL